MHPANKLLDLEVNAHSAFDFRAPAALPFNRGNAWIMPAFLKGHGTLDRIAWWRARR